MLALSIYQNFWRNYISKKLLDKRGCRIEKSIEKFFGVYLEGCTLVE